MELNGVSVAANVQTFQWGRLAAIDPERVHRLAQPAQAIAMYLPQRLRK